MNIFEQFKSGVSRISKAITGFLAPEPKHRVAQESETKRKRPRRRIGERFKTIRGRLRRNADYYSASYGSDGGSSKRRIYPKKQREKKPKLDKLFSWQRIKPPKKKRKRRYKTREEQLKTKERAEKRKIRKPKITPEQIEQDIDNQIEQGLENLKDEFERLEQQFDKEDKVKEVEDFWASEIEGAKPYRTNSMFEYTGEYPQNEDESLIFQLADRVDELMSEVSRFGQEGLSDWKGIEAYEFIMKFLSKEIRNARENPEKYATELKKFADSVYVAFNLGYVPEVVDLYDTTHAKKFLNTVWSVGQKDLWGEMGVNGQDFLTDMRAKYYERGEFIGKHDL